MIIDAHEVPEGTTLDTDICIVGAGAAGITLAREFAGAAFRVCLLESGGLESDGKTQDLYKGENIGRHYYDLDICRLRYFGGSTNHWGGICRPLKAADFEERSWIPYSGWPFGLAELDPFYPRAQAILRLGAYGYDAGFLKAQPGRELLPLDENRIVTEVIQFSPLTPYGSTPPTFFGDTYRAEIAAAGNVTVYLQANVTKIETTNTANAVTRLEVATLSGRKFSVSAKNYILAAGGIENARLLLVSNETESTGLGNRHDLVGRFFMDHPQPQIGLVLPITPGDARWASYCFDYYDYYRKDPLEPIGTLALHDAVQAQEQILHCAIGFEYVEPGSKGWLALRRVIHGNSKGIEQLESDLWGVVSGIEGIAVDAYEKLRHGSISPRAFAIYGHGQQAPNPDSRVALGDERDPLGLRRPRLDLRLSELDRYSIKRTLQIVAQELGKAGLARVQMAFDDWPAEFSYGNWPATFSYGNHHIGTLRMSADPRRGVVDANCRVHGVENLYIAGSAVFPTSGAANPTLTIVALALRLAGHIKASMRA